MSFSPRIRYLLVIAAILTASTIQLVRGYRPVIVIVGAITFLIVGNLTVYVSGSKDRKRRRQLRRDEWAN